ncbi:MAG: hypothetical protein J2P13_00330 [Acidobacteria bacterium]|nr:hypothetical protein [Acidobacteriota bacterium]
MPVFLAGDETEGRLENIVMKVLETSALALEIWRTAGQVSTARSTGEQAPPEQALRSVRTALNCPGLRRILVHFFARHRVHNISSFHRVISYNHVFTIVGTKSGSKA